MKLQEIISNYSVVGFSGSRSINDAEVLERAIALILIDSQTVVVGCAKGVDEKVRENFPEAKVFAVNSGKWGKGKSAFARRSCACVEFVKEAGGLWLSFPASPAPKDLIISNKSSKAFSGKGSGTWASASYAIGNGVATIIFHSVPSNWKGKRSLDDFSAYYFPGFNQLSLF